MIFLDRLCKGFSNKGAIKVVARDISFTFPAGQSVGLLGRNGAGKSTLLRLIGGTMAPDSGRIASTGSVSWPVAFSSGLHPDMTGAQNARFVARLYSVPPDDMVDICADMSELGPDMNRPVREYSAGMRARLAFSMSMVIEFDTYLIDEITAVGDLAFRQKCTRILGQRLKSSGAIIVSHAPDLLRQLCQSGVVLQNGRLFYYEKLEKALDHQKYAVRGDWPPWLT